MQFFRDKIGNITSWAMIRRIHRRRVISEMASGIRAVE